MPKYDGLDVSLGCACGVILGALAAIGTAVWLWG